MNDSTVIPDEEIQRASELIQSIKASIETVFIGQSDVVSSLLNCLVANGHALVEGVPGLGKTLLVRALAKCIDGSTTRIQFTPDLMPTDVTGHSIYNLKEEKFVVRKGPVFTNLLLADEINRAPAKTQSALLEVMQERRVTIEGEAFSVGSPFMVMATQNPLEQEGTYPLPEAQLDRFMVKILIDCPSEEDEAKLAEMVTAGKAQDTLDVGSLTAIASGSDVEKLQQIASLVTVDEQVLSYSVRIARATRADVGILQGAGPRAPIAMLRMSRAAALSSGRDFVTPDDVKESAKQVLRHRITLSPEVEIEGTNPDTLLDDLLQKVDAPRT